MNLFKTLSNYDKHRKIYRNSHQLAHRKLCPSFRRHQCWNRRVHRWVPKHIDVDTFYVTIALLAILAWYKSGKGVSIFTILGLLLIWGMGFWNETMQTLALVLSSTIIALIMGLPLGIWSANSKRCDKILHPILDLMQTMPAFVYLIPAVLFSGWEPFRELLPPLFCHASRSASDQLGYQASTEECYRSFALFWCDTYAIIIQGTITAGIAHHHDRYKPDNPNVALHGGHCRYDCSRRVRGNRIERYHADENRFRFRRRYRSSHPSHHSG